MSAISDYDIRQLYLMLEFLDSFERNEISLFSLQGSLEYLFQMMEFVDPSWENLFIDEICIIASINAGIPENVKNEINIQEIINKSICNLKNLIEKYLMSVTEQFQGKTGILAEENWVICPYCFEPLEPPQIDLVLVCPKCSQCFSNPLQNKSRSQEKHDDN